MKLIINGKDLTGLTGEVSEFKGEILLPLNFLETLQYVGVRTSKTGNEFRIDFAPEALLKLLSKSHPFPADLELKIEKEKDGKVKTKAQLGIGDFGTASVDQDGKIEGGIHLKF